jgi:hypothetical protein
MSESTPPQKAALGWPLQQPRQPDDRREQQDGAEEERRVGHVELRGLVMRGVVVLLPVLGGVRWVDDRRGKDDEGGDDHEDAEADPLGVGTTSAAAPVG